jgi:threonine/homoserine/homoserine lactone efflux protein|tara:strand:- start:10 stop:315 length:306 start_codon:yes stop_codon:yes gene_type:complete
LFGDSPLAYEVGKISAALYLIYLGVRYFISQNSELETNVRLPTQSLNQVFRESILVEVTNPKTALFFLALLPQFVVPEAGFAAPQLLILGLTNSHSLRNTL